MALLVAQRLVPTLGGPLVDLPELEVPERVREQVRAAACARASVRPASITA